MKNPMIHQKCGGRNVSRIVVARVEIRWNGQGSWDLNPDGDFDIQDVVENWCEDCETSEGEFDYEPEG